MEKQDFLLKARNYNANRLKMIEIEIEGFGKLEIVRPKEDALLEFMSDSMKYTELNADGTPKSIDFVSMAKISNKLVYLSCPMMQAKEVRDEFSKGDPFEIPENLFGAMEVIRIAGEISEKFESNQTKKEIEEEIKN